MSAYSEKVIRREKGHSPQSLPPVGAWVRNPSGGKGQVVEHIFRENRPPVARVRFQSKHGTYLPGELTDIGEEAV